MTSAHETPRRCARPAARRRDLQPREELPPPLPPQPCADLEPQLWIAREEPSERSLAAANAVLECDPIGQEILALKRGIERELKGTAAAECGAKLVDLGGNRNRLE